MAAWATARGAGPLIILEDRRSWASRAPTAERVTARRARTLVRHFAGSPRAAPRPTVPVLRAPHLVPVRRSPASSAPSRHTPRPVRRAPRPSPPWRRPIRVQASRVRRGRALAQRPARQRPSRQPRRPVRVRRAPSRRPPASRTRLAIADWDLGASPPRPSPLPIGIWVPLRRAPAQSLQPAYCRYVAPRSASLS
jgi:hypothetical protein